MKTQKAATGKKKKAYIGLHLDPDLSLKVKQAADDERRTVSQFIRVVLERTLEAKSA